MSEVSDALAALQTEVDETRGAVESTITFIGGLKDLLNENAGNAAKIREIAATLDSQQQALAAAISSNPTPPEPTPEPTPEPAPGG